MTERSNIDSGVLYIVPTPIGNLSDMVPRAIDVLQMVNVIAAEDTRHSAKIMQHFQISTPMVAYHEHSGEQKVQSIVDKLLSGKNVALISDAGTPLVSDPGYRLVLAARDNSIKIIPIPGACAAIAALSASGLPSDRFSFEGFPPSKAGARVKCFKALIQETRTLIFYESPHRIAATLEDVVSTFGSSREIVIGREITKTFETFISGSAEEVLQTVTNDRNQQKGEIVLMIKGDREVSVRAGLDVEAERVMEILLEENFSVKQASSLTAKITGEKKNKIYDWALGKL